MSRYLEFERCRQRLLVALQGEMANRSAYRDLSWIEAERLALVEAANTWALSHGGTIVTVDEVERIEASAVGHADYASKLALYVAELVYGRSPFVLDLNVNQGGVSS